MNDDTSTPSKDRLSSETVARQAAAIVVYSVAIALGILVVGGAYGVIKVLWGAL